MENIERRRDETTDGLWRAIAALLQWRRFIIGTTFLMALVAIVVSLLLPKQYLGTTRLLLPEGSGGSIASALMGDLSGAAQSLLGGGGDYVRYLAILSSRTMYERVVDEFELVTVYGTHDSPTARDDAVELLVEKSEFTIDNEYDFLTIEVLDGDPQRAADMANFYVSELNSTNSRLSSQAATGLLTYVEARFARADLDLSALLDSTERYQSRYGIFDIEAQTGAYFNQLAELRSSIIEAEIQSEVLRQQFGAQNRRVQGLEQVVRAANRKYQAALDGKENLLPVPSDSIPQAARQYANLALERTIQERIIEYLAPLLEQARFEEKRETQAVQVIDRAFPPSKKARPLRTLIVVAVTVSAFLISVLFVLLVVWWRSSHERLVARLSIALNGEG